MIVETRMGKITACREVLNLISMSFFESAEKHKEDGMLNMARYKISIALDIQKALEETGYYDK